MKLFLSCVSSEFKSYRLRLANQFGALKGHAWQVKVQEDFQQGGYTLLEKLADYIRECDCVIHLAGEHYGICPSAEHVRTLLKKLGDAIPDTLPNFSYTQWEYHLAQRFKRKTLVYLAAPEQPHGPTFSVQEGSEQTRLQERHVNQIRRSGKHYGQFSSYVNLAREIFHDLGLESRLKVNNLPYKSLGSLFKGRDEFLDQVYDALGCAEHRGHERFAAITASTTAASVHGLGGIGKTRAAIEYAHRYSESYSAILFVRASSPINLQQNLGELCGPTALDLPEKTFVDSEKQATAVLQWLQQHPGWLLIVDGVDTKETASALQGLSAEERLRGPRDPYLAQVLNNLASGLRDLVQMEEAKRVLRTAIAIREELPEPENPDLAAALNNLAELLAATNRLSEAESLHQRALAINEACYSPTHPKVVKSLNNMANLLFNMGRLAECKLVLERLLKVLFEISQAQAFESPLLAITTRNYETVLARLGYSQARARARLEEIRTHSAS